MLGNFAVPWRGILMFVITFLVPHHFYSVSFEETLVGKDRSRAVKIGVSKETYI